MITLGIIGVVAAMNIPTLITSYRKHVVEVQLKHSYSVINQAVKLLVVENEDILGWDFSLSAENFMKKYIIPYMKVDMSKAQTGNVGMVGDVESVVFIVGTQFYVNIR